jgi:hypothetical protein
MKKAFDANVSRAKPRLRLGAMMTATAEAPANEVVSAAAVEALAQQVVQEAAPVIPSVDVASELGAALKAKAQARAAKGTAAEVLQEALLAEEPRAFERRGQADDAPRVAVHTPTESPRADAAPRREHPVAVRVAASVEPRPEVVEVQTAPPPHAEPDVGDPAERREKLRERLKAVRENPRPEPLPDTVAEAGVLAVERISALQTELTKARAMNLALAQDLEAARRQAERATEEARMRMDEARRLSKEMEGRVTLLSELERELEALEGERNESLLALQESRQVLEAREREKQELSELVARKDQEISESLAEEERLAGELEQAQEANLSLRRSADALKGERDTLARQVSELTRERAELLEARKALEAVHRALSTAARR